MIRLRLLWLLPLLALTQAGCALFTTYSKGEAQIDQWVENEQYGRALKALGRVDPKDPDYLAAAAKRRQVEALAARYEHEVRQRNNALLKQGKWAAALDSYDEALDRLPDSVLLKDGLAQLHRRQARELEQLELQRLLDHGNWLKQTLPTFRDISRVDPRSGSAQRRLEEVQREAEVLADELTLNGNRALANNQLDQAEELLSLADDLSDAPAIKESLKKLQQQQSDSARKARSERQRRLQRQQEAERSRQQTIEALLTEFDRAFEKREFNQARLHLQALADHNLETNRYRTLQQKLSRAVAQESSRLFNLGVNAYSRGNFEQAAASWREVLALQPDHKQAQENLQRAERVLDKIERLKQKQQQ